MTTWTGPEVLGVGLGDATDIEDGWLVRDLVVPDGLDGPPGVLQGGFAAGMLMIAARAYDAFGAPITAVDARLHAPTPLGATHTVRVRPTYDPARYEVELRDAERLLVSGVVELAGHDPAPHAHDLTELAAGPRPESRPQERYRACWVCGSAPSHTHAQRMYPAWRSDDIVVSTWLAEDELATPGGHVDPFVVAALLDCPGAWAALPTTDALGYAGVVLASFHLRFVRDAPVMEPLVVPGRLDAVEGRKLTARTALVDEDGVVYAVASALHVAVKQLPDLT